MEKHRLLAGQIQVNHPLPWDVFDESGMLLLRKGYPLMRESQLQVLLARGLYVDSKEFQLSPQGAGSAAKTDPFRVWNSILLELEALLRNVHLEKDFSAQMKGLATTIQKLSTRNPDTALAAIMLMDQQRYAISHSLNVGLIVELAAKRIGWDDARRCSACCAAMTMNLAMLDLQNTLCLQRIAPNVHQREEIRRHPEMAENLLKQAGVTDPVWLKAVLEHHEMPDGKGYPYGLKDPCDESQLIRMADIFTAKVSSRGSRKALAVHQAARSLFVHESQGASASSFPAALIKEVGLFPPGSFVKLANGETGVVLKRGNNANTPIVYSLINPMGLSYGSPIRREAGRKGLEIVEVLPKEKISISIDIERLWRTH